MSDHERPCGCLFKGYEIVSQCIYHTGRQHLIESLQRENGELKAAIKQNVIRASCVQCADLEQQIKELRIKLHNQAAKAEEQAFMWRERLEKAEAAAITPEMRERLPHVVIAAQTLLDLAGPGSGAHEHAKYVCRFINEMADLLGEQG